MDTARLKRYGDKLEIISKRMAEIEEWEEDFADDEKTKLACYKAFQEIVEAAMDVAAMVVKDAGTIPKDDYSNIDLIVGKKIISKNIAKRLIEANGLRNRVVHHYNGLKAKLAHDSMVELLPFFAEFVESVTKWLGRQ